MVYGVDQVATGRPKGTLNGQTRDFKQAVSNLLEHAAPKMVEWLDAIAQENPSKALDHIAGFAEYCFPKLSRAENINKSVGIVQIVLAAAKQQGLVAAASAENLTIEQQSAIAEAVGSQIAENAPETQKNGGIW